MCRYRICNLLFPTEADMKSTHSPMSNLDFVYRLMFIGVVFVIVTTTISISFGGNRSQLSFTRSIELRALCYAWACLAMLLTSRTLELKWLVPVSILTMWAFTIVFPFFAMSPPDLNKWRVWTRIGILVGVVLGVALDLRIRWLRRF